ncbi:transketolase [Candidatus Jorgensenbacteria bacterium]|nr:transketolase [Candidatus Jorgensenbacteria bacterium]
MEEEDSKNIKKIRIDILDMCFKAKEGHVPSSFSVVEILYTLYKKMAPNDVFFLSKGHASAALFAVLAHFGLLDRSELKTYCAYDSRLGGHPHRFPNLIMSSTGSLGHGFPIAAGYALSKKIKQEPGRVFCVVGDGETNEGSIWETAMYAEQLKLSNLVCVVDKNDSQIRAMTSINIDKKFKEFGWKTQVVNGHNSSELEKILFDKSVESNNQPYCVIANTVKGKGVKEMERDMFAWHHRSPTDTELARFKEELLQTL